MDTFFTQKNCDRCHKPFDGARTMSRFSTDCICERCAAKERQHPDYRKAVEAELEAIRRGEFNYRGIDHEKNGRK